METTFLEYYKQILNKVSFDNELFHKEYLKASKILNKHDREELKKWVERYHFINLKKFNTSRFEIDNNMSKKIQSA